MAPLTEAPICVQEAIDHQYTVAKTFTGWNDERGLYEYLYDKTNQNLPHFNTRSATEVIEDAVNKSTGNVTIVDLGCGHGLFLQACLKNWPDRIRAIGLSASIRPDSPSDLRQQDIHSADKILGTDVADVIVASWSFPYLADPWGAVQAANRILRMGGIALINSVPFTTIIDGDEKARNNFLSKIQQECGIQIAKNTSSDASNGLKIAWQKTQNELPIPLSYAGRTTIIKEASSGTPFVHLSAVYSVDL